MLTANPVKRLLLQIQKELEVVEWKDSQVVFFDKTSKIERESLTDSINSIRSKVL
jgi:hypothetical protein